MKATSCVLRLAIGPAGTLALGLCIAGAQTASGGETYPIDLPTALRLAGAQNLDVQIARQAVDEAEANRTVALEQFFPWLAAGGCSRRRNGLAQAVPGATITETHYHSYAPGATLSTQVAVGDAIYNALAAKQLVRASDRALDAQRQESILGAASGYFDLAKAKALLEVARQALTTSQDYHRQRDEAVGIGIAFKGDQLRVATQTGLYEIGVRQTLEQQRIAAATLSRVLHLDPEIELVPQDNDLVPLRLLDTDVAPDVLVQRALAS